LRTRRSRSAPASSSIERFAVGAAAAAAVLWLAGAAAAAETGDAVRLRMAELEAALAKQPRLYLVLEPAAKRLSVRARGLTLQTVEIRELSALAFRPLFGGEEPPPLEAPAVWKVTQGPGDTDRETIAPTTLRPYSEEEEMEEPAAGPPGATPTPRPGEAEKPSSYRVALDNGWQLFVVDQPPSLGWLARFRAAVRDGWQRLKGVEPAHPPLVTIVVDADAARGLHHLFRSGTEILVAPGA
jgi:hypothetical protein